MIAACGGPSIAGKAGGPRIALSSFNSSFNSSMPSSTFSNSSVIGLNVSFKGYLLSCSAYCPVLII